MRNIENNEWSVCILSSRESVTDLMISVKGVYQACRNKKTLIDVVINGNEMLANNLANLLSLELDSSVGNKIRIWDLNLADKAMAWNSYLYNIWPGSDLVFFLDGYVRPYPNALIQIEEGIDNKVEALGSTGVPTMGYSAKSLRENMLQNGGLHGNLFAIKGEVCTAMKEIDFHLPAGIYRNDSTIGAVIAFNLDPKKNNWNLKERIIVNKDATWSIPEQNEWSLNFFKSFIKRYVRQAQGELENKALKQHFAILKKSPKTLPRYVDELIYYWIKSDFKQSIWFFLCNPISLYAFVLMKSRMKNSKKDFNKSKRILITEGFYNGE